MRIYNPCSPDEVRECIASVDAFLESHRIDPYTLDEIAEMGKPVPKKPVCKVPVVPKNGRPDYE